MADATVIVAKLDKRELENSINELVRTIDSKLTDAALSFDAGIGLMQNSLKTFANNARATVKEIKNAFTQLGTTFNDFANAMQAATRNASRGAASASGAASGGGGGGITAAPGTVGELRQQITEAQLLLDTYQQQSPALQSAVDKLVKQRNLLKQMLTDSETISKKNFGNLFAKYNAMPTRELSQAEEKLRNLRSLANIAPQGILGTAAWQRLQTAIDRTQAKVNQLKMSVASAPRTTQGVMGMSEKTLDEIGRKMQAISQLRLGMNIKTQRGEITMLNAEYARLGKMQDSLLGKNVSLIDSNGALARSFTYIRNRIVYALTLGATTQFVRDLYEVRGQYELLERSLGVLTDSMQKGTQIFQELSQMALKSPFTLVELGTAAKQLTAYNFSANEVVDTTRRLADISAALGVPMERLTYNLGQIRAQTVLTARDARDFANAGLPMVKTLADYYSRLEGRVVSTGDVYDRMSKKMVSYNDVMAVLIEMTDEGGKFFDFQAKQADTLRVQMANLSLAWNNILNDIGKANQGLLTTPLAALRTIFQNWQMIDKVLWDVAVTLGAVKAAQLATNFVMGSSLATMRASILADKQKIANDLQRQALTRALTKEELELVRTRRLVTAADYQQALSAQGVTKQQALMLVAFQKGNKELMMALKSMNLLTAAEISNMNVGKALMLTLEGVRLSLNSIFTSFMRLLPSLGVFAGLMAGVHIFQSWREEVRKTEELNNQAAQNARESSASIKKFFEDYENDLSRINSGDASDDKQKQVWSALKDEIEKSVVASDEYISRLLQIENISERIKAGEAILKDAQRIQDVIAILGDDQAIKLGKGETFGEGIAKDLAQYVDNIKTIVEEYGNTAETWTKINKILSDPDSYGSFSSFMQGAADPWRNFAQSAKEAQSEVNATIDNLEGNFERFREQILGDEPERWAANIRQYAESMQKEFLSSEEGQKIQGKQLDEMKRNIDEWVAKTIQANTNAIWFAGGEIERQNTIYLARTRTAWEDFYKAVGLLGNKEQERLMELIRTGQYLEEEHQAEFRSLWMKASQAMQESATMSYNLIKSQINDLNTQRIVIPVLFKPQTTSTSDLQKQFDEDFKGTSFQFLRPKDEENLINYSDRATKALKERTAAYEAAKRQYDAIPESEKVLRNEAKKILDISEAEKKAAQEVVDSWHLIEQETKKAKGGKGGGTKKDVLGESLSKEVQLIDDIQKRFKEYRTMGVNSQNALNLATEEYGNSLDIVSKKLAQFGIKTKSTSELAQMDLRAVRDYYKSLLTIASGVGNTKGIEALEKAIAKINIEITKIDYKKITDSLNNELSKLKDEYELAVALDADPELGSIFLDTLGISKEELSELPKTAAEVAARAQELISKALKENEPTKDLTFDLAANLNKANLADWFKGSGIDIESELGKRLTALVEYVNKLRTDETKKQIQEWDKLLDKYAEYETKRKRIMDEAERERQTALRQNATQDIFDAIERRTQRELARVDFERFQELPTWVTATGDIANLTDNALGMLIDRLQEYKKNAKNLDPKQIKQINNALSKLYREQRKDNPFVAFISAYEQAKERFNDYEVTITDIEDELDRLRKKQSAWTFEEAERFTNLTKLLKRLRKEQDAVSEVSVVDVVKGFQSMAQAVSNAVSNIKEMTDALGGSQMVNELSQVVSVFSKAGEMAAAGAQMGGAWGAAAGAALGLLSGIVTTFADEWSGNADISRQVTNSERAVRKLEQAYNQLEHAMESAYGDAVMGAQRLIVLNKEAQLYELERQIVLEKSRKAKNRDEDKILDLQGEVEDLKNEINDAINEITNNLLGTSSVGDAAESMVDAMISALRNGEDALESFNGSVDDMIANVVKKFVVTRTLGPLMERTWKELETVTSRRTIPIEQEIRLLQQERADLQARYDRWYENVKGNKKDVEMLEPYRKQLEEYDQKISDAEQRLLDASMLREDDVDVMVALLERLKQEGSPVAELLETMLNRFGLNGEGETQELSSLQQGIQGITETTANALEAYMNGVLQQVYLHSTLLTEIRDFLIPQEGDIQLDVQAQMLLQLQASYQTQEAIRSMLEGWNNASGQAVRVEII